MSELLMDQLAATNMVYARFSFPYFLASMQRLGVHNIELYGCTTHFHFYDGDEAVARAKKLLRDSGLKVISRHSSAFSENRILYSSPAI